MKLQWSKIFLFGAVFIVFGVLAQYDSFETHVFMDVSGNSLPYRLLKPLREDATKSYPLVLFLHGAGDVGNDNVSQLNNFPQCFLDSNNRESYPCYIVAPQCPADDSWDSFPNYPYSIETSVDPTPAMAMVLSLIDTLRSGSTVHVDKLRTYVTGFSLGGEGTYDILTRAPDWFAAAIPICGIADTGKATLIKDIPLWIFHGSLDEVNDVKYDRMEVEVLRRLGSKPKYTEYGDLYHECWTTAYSEPDLLSWMFSQNKQMNNAVIHTNGNYYVKSNYGAAIKNHTLLISWNYSEKPEAAQLFALNGKCVFQHRIFEDGSSSASIGLPHIAHGAVLLKLVGNNRPVYIRTIVQP